MDGSYEMFGDHSGPTTSMITSADQLEILAT